MDVQLNIVQLWLSQSILSSHGMNSESLPENGTEKSTLTEDKWLPVMLTSLRSSGDRILSSMRLMNLRPCAQMEELGSSAGTHARALAKTLRS